MKNERDPRFATDMDATQALVGMMISLDPRGGEHEPEDRRAFLALWNDCWLPTLERSGVRMDQPFADMLGPRTLMDFPETNLARCRRTMTEVAEELREKAEFIFAAHGQVGLPNELIAWASRLSEEGEAR